MAHKLDHPKKKEIIEAIHAKEKWTWIQSEYGCGSGTISKYRKELKLQPPNLKTTLEQRIAIVVLRGTKTLKELADRYGVSISYVSKLHYKNIWIAKPIEMRRYFSHRGRQRKYRKNK